MREGVGGGRGEDGPMLDLSAGVFPPGDVEILPGFGEVLLFPGITDVLSSGLSVIVVKVSVKVVTSKVVCV